MNIMVAGYTFSNGIPFVWEPLEVTRETKKCYFTKAVGNTENRFLKDEIGKVQYHTCDQWPYIKVAMIDATEEELREKLAEWFEQRANKIRKTK